MLIHNFSKKFLFRAQKNQWEYYKHICVHTHNWSYIVRLTLKILFVMNRVLSYQCTNLASWPWLFTKSVEACWTHNLIIHVFLLISEVCTIFCSIIMWYKITFISLLISKMHSACASSLSQCTRHGRAGDAGWGRAEWGPARGQPPNSQYYTAVVSAHWY